VGTKCGCAAASRLNNKQNYSDIVILFAHIYSSTELLWIMTMPTIDFLGGQPGLVLRILLVHEINKP
jgi:hypothetical protein